MIVSLAALAIVTGAVGFVGGVAVWFVVSAGRDRDPEG